MPLLLLATLTKLCPPACRFLQSSGTAVELECGLKVEFAEEERLCKCKGTRQPIHVVCRSSIPLHNINWQDVALFHTHTTKLGPKPKPFPNRTMNKPAALNFQLAQPKLCKNRKPSQNQASQYTVELLHPIQQIPCKRKPCLLSDALLSPRHPHELPTGNSVNYPKPKTHNLSTRRA